MRRKFFLFAAMACSLAAVHPARATVLPARISVILPAGTKTLQIVFLDRADTVHAKVMELKASPGARMVKAGLDLPFQEVVNIGGTSLLLAPGDEVSLKLSGNGKDLSVASPMDIKGNCADRQRLLARIDSVFHLPDSIYQKYHLDFRNSLYSKWSSAGLLPARYSLDAEEVKIGQLYVHMRDLRQKKEYLAGIGQGDSIHQENLAWVLADINLDNPYLDRVADEVLLKDYAFYCMNIMRLFQKPINSREEENFLMGPVYVLRTAQSDRVKDMVSHEDARAMRFYGPDDEAFGQFIRAVDSSIHSPRLLQYYDSIWASFQPQRAGMPAYNFMLESDKGKFYQLSDFRGKMVVIDVWATWCNGCVAALPSFERIATDWKDSAGVVFLNIAWQEQFSRVGWHKFLKDHHMEDGINLVLPENWSDAEMVRYANGYHHSGVPRYMVIDKEGKILDLYMPFPYDALFLERLNAYYRQQKSR